MIGGVKCSFATKQHAKLVIFFDWNKKTRQIYTKFVVEYVYNEFVGGSRVVVSGLLGWYVGGLYYAVYCPYH